MCYKPQEVTPAHENKQTHLPSPFSPSPSPSLPCNVPLGSEQARSNLRVPQTLQTLWDRDGFHFFSSPLLTHEVFVSFSSFLFVHSSGGGEGRKGSFVKVGTYCFNKEMRYRTSRVSQEGGIHAVLFSCSFQSNTYFNTERRLECPLRRMWCTS
mmetsp:Transcript_11698/g.31504  ORF Transcript_11698/g.31504 Transcript_11698/m.31504 type:complete len:154 (-) Transcript_11698:117-578(-)